MKLRTRVRDCLYLNWALPAAALPSPPVPLRYEVHAWDGEDYVFASALLFHQEGLHLSSFPLIRLSYPQFNLRLYVLDPDGVPSVLFLKVLVPAWIVPGARWLAHQPVARARFSYPSPSQDPEAEAWSWRVQDARVLQLKACVGAPSATVGPSLGSWEATVEHFRQRPRGYAVGPDGLRRAGTRHPAVQVWPMKVEVEQADLLEACLPLEGVSAWPTLHSAWLCPEIPFIFELTAVPRVRVPRQVPAPG